MTAVIIVLALVAAVVLFVVSIYNSLVKLRNQVKNAWSQIDVQLKRRHGVGDKAKAEGELTSALGKFNLVVENYPDLKANQNFLSLQEELTSTENKISFSRQSYNDQVLFYNNKIQMFPSNIIAGMFKFNEEEFFEIEDEKERAVPKVSFGKN
jgi:LemA protein